MINRVCAVIVTYQSSLEVVNLLDLLRVQLEHIYVVDNGSSPEVIKRLSEFGSAVSLISNQENLGIAEAQNQGVRLALAAGYDWVLLMDDDSRPATNMVEKMLMAYHVQHDHKIAIIAPRLVEQNIQIASRHLVARGRYFFHRKELKAGDIMLDAVMVIASGSMVRADMFKQVGLMRRDLFIDYVDHEFCLRVVAIGYKILLVGDAVLAHKQGNKHYHSLAGVSFKTAHYSALRYYYIFRNRMFFLRLYAVQFPFLVAHECLACGLDAVRVLLFESEKRAKLSAMIKALRQGLTSVIPNI